MEVAVFVWRLPLLLCALLAPLQATRVYNANARSPDGSHDMRIQIIQVGIVNVDQTGRRITTTPPPVTLDDGIRHRVTWSQETGFVVRDTPMQHGPAPRLDPPRTHMAQPPPTFASRAPVAVPSPVPDSTQFLATVLVLTVGLAFLLALAYLVTVLVHRRRKKKQQQQVTGPARIVYRPNFVPREPILFEHDYENLSDMDEEAAEGGVCETVVPPPVPPRRQLSTGRPAMHPVLDQPVGWLLEKQRSVPARPPLVKQKSRIEDEVQKQLLKRQSTDGRISRGRGGSF